MRMVLWLLLALVGAAPDSVGQLQAIKPLPKTHYSWALSSHVWEDANRPLLVELARITHAISVSGEWATEERIRTAVEVCKSANASIGVNYMPWHRRFGEGLPPTDNGKTHRAELQQFTDRLLLIRAWLAQANAKHDASVRVSALLLDSERFYTRPDDDLWNQAITDKLDAFSHIVKEIFPDARIEWFGLGVQPSSSSTGWSVHRWNTGEIETDAGSCSLYRVPEIETTRATFRRTLVMATERGLSEVTPWVALASGYRRHVDAFKHFDHNWSYDLIYSWQLGAELNIPWYGNRPERFLPGRAAKVVVFWPPPFDPRTPAWGEHFVAYVLGATGVRALAVDKSGPGSDEGE